eukprot:760407-Hanusia_phi.AAC.2
MLPSAEEEVENAGRMRRTMSSRLLVSALLASLGAVSLLLMQAKFNGEPSALVQLQDEAYAQQASIDGMEAMQPQNLRYAQYANDNYLEGGLTSSLVQAPQNYREIPQEDSEPFAEMQQGGITYMPSTEGGGISSRDQSPGIPQPFLNKESRLKRKLKHMASVLKRSRKQEGKLDKELVEVRDLVKRELTDVKDEVVAFNTKETDMINAPYHLVQGPRGPPGLPGMNGLDGMNGKDGFPGSQGPRGPQGLSGPSGEAGLEGAIGPKGPRGPKGVFGIKGISGRAGPDGLQGDAQVTETWRPSRYFCPGAGNHYTRLVDCNTGSCRLEVNYNGNWGTVCSRGFTAESATTVCKGLGFPEGGVARRRGGGTGHIWLSNVMDPRRTLEIAPGPVAERDVPTATTSAYAVGDSTLAPGVPEMLPETPSLRFETSEQLATFRTSEKGEATFAAGCYMSGWKTSFSIGRYSEFGGGECDDDLGMCTHLNCPFQPNQLSSMEVPAGLKVTLFSRKYFRGSHITFVGPRKVDCLVWESWNDKTRSMLIEGAKKLPESIWVMRVAASVRQITSLPSIKALPYIGQADIDFVNFPDIGGIREYVHEAPSEKVTAAFYGSVLIETSGEYTFCITSDDGSKLWIEGRM